VEIARPLGNRAGPGGGVAGVLRAVLVHHAGAIAELTALGAEALAVAEALVRAGRLAADRAVGALGVVLTDDVGADLRRGAVAVASALPSLADDGDVAAPDPVGALLPVAAVDAAEPGVVQGLDQTEVRTVAAGVLARAEDTLVAVRTAHRIVVVLADRQRL